MKLAIDFGASVTKIYKLGSGIVLTEATCVAMRGDEIVAYGNDAKRLFGKTSSDVTVRFPVYEGEIKSPRLAASLLGYFLDKVDARKVEALFCVPCGITDDNRAKYVSLAGEAGIRKVHFVEVPFLSALGQDVPLSESNPVFCIDIGAGCTSIAAFSSGGMIAGLSMNVGGNNMDVHIIDYIAEKYGLQIGLLTSEKVKNTIGSFLEYDNQSTIINGQDRITGHPRSVSVSSPDVRTPIALYLDKILEYAEILLKKLPAEVSAAICKNGIYLSGGVSKLSGIAEYVQDKLQIETNLAEEAQMAVVLGGGRVLGDPALLRKLELF